MRTVKPITKLFLILLSISIFTTSCKEKEVEVLVTEICGCMDATAVNYNAEANCDDEICIFPSMLDDTTRTFYSAAAHANDPLLTPYMDPIHGGVTWRIDYKEFGFTKLTGSFGSFDGEMTFNEKDPSLTKLEGWVRLSSQVTTEPERDEPGNCGQTFHQVVWNTHQTVVGLDTFTVYDSTIAATDFAYLEVTGGEFYFPANKRSFTTSYKSTGTLTYLRGADNGNILGEAITSTIDVYFYYNGIDYEAGRTGFDGFFEFNCKSDHGQQSASASDIVLVEFHIPMRGL